MLTRVRTPQGTLIPARDYLALARSAFLSGRESTCSLGHFRCAAWDGGPCSEDLAKLVRPRIGFDDTPYFRSHGRAPRGRGAWAFATTPRPDWDDIVWSPSMTFSEARKWARAHFAKHCPGTDGTLYVMP